MDGEFFNRTIWGHKMKITSIPGGVTKGKDNDRYIIFFEEILQGQPGPTMMIMSKQVDGNGKFKWMTEKNSPLFGGNWEDFLKEVGEEIDRYNIEKAEKSGGE